MKRVEGKLALNLLDNEQTCFTGELVEISYKNKHNRVRMNSYWKMSSLSILSPSLRCLL